MLTLFENNESYFNHHGDFLNDLDKKFENEPESKGFFRKHGLSLLVLIAIMVIVSAITYYRIRIQMDLGPLSDSCDFLSNALIFAGQDMGYSDLTRPPFFSFIISLFFRLGYVYTSTIFVVDGLFFMFGVIGLFLFLKLRFNNIESFLGGLIYATFFIVLAVLGFGFSDLASVSIAIWVFYFLVSAVEKNSNYFYLLFPFVMLAFLTRYNMALLVFPITLYILINKNNLKVFKRKIVTGIFISILMLLPVFILFYVKFDDIFYPFSSFFGTTTHSFSSQLASYYPNPLFFIERFPFLTGFSTDLIIVIIIVGLVIYGILKLKNHNKKLVDALRIKKGIKKTSTKIKLIIFTLLTLIFIGTFGQVFWMISEIIFFVLAYMFYDLVKSYKIHNLSLNLLVFAWFMVFFIFHSVYVIKDNRYFVVMAPAVSYFLILGLDAVSNRLKLVINNRNMTFPLIAVVLTIIMITSAASDLQVIYQANYDYKINNENIDLASQWFMNYDPNYKTKKIYSEVYPWFSWTLQTNIKSTPKFKDNQTLFGIVAEYNMTQQDNIALNNYLVSNNADYYFSNRMGLNLTSYTLIKQFGNYTIYKRIV